MHIALQVDLLATDADPGICLSDGPKGDFVKTHRAVREALPSSLPCLSSSLLQHW